MSGGNATTTLSVLSHDQYQMLVIPIFAAQTPEQLPTRNESAPAK